MLTSDRKGEGTGTAAAARAPSRVPRLKPLLNGVPVVKTLGPQVVPTVLLYVIEDIFLKYNPYVCLPNSLWVKGSVNYCMSEYTLGGRK